MQDPASENASQEKQETVLVVDDNATVLHTVVEVLKRGNFHVLSAEGPKQAMKISQETQGTIHLLLSDVEMPDMPGPILGETLKRARPEMKVMLMSGGANGNLLVLNYGWAYIQKPFVSKKLMEMVKSVLNTPDRAQSKGQEFDSRKDNPPERE